MKFAVPALFLFFLSIFSPLTAAEDAVPWPNGETLNYSIAWGVVSAANATFTATDAGSRWEFRLHIVSKGAVETLYPITDWFWSYQQKSPWRSIEYGEDRSERTKRIRERTQVDYVGKLAVREKWTKGETDRIILTGEPLDDIGSMLYSLRRGSWKVGDKRPITVYESYEVKTGEATCLAIEKKIFAPWPEQECIQIECLPTGATKAKQKGALMIWLTNDARRLPLRSELQFKYGTFTLSLVQP